MQVHLCHQVFLRMYISCKTNSEIKKRSSSQLLLLLPKDSVFPIQSSPYVLQYVKADAKLEIKKLLSNCIIPLLIH